MRPVDEEAAVSRFGKDDSVMGAKENGRSRLPRSDSGEPRVHSSQSSMPITLGSVGWKIYRSAGERQRPLAHIPDGRGRIDGSG
jgi:hypothetical protein